MGKCVYCGKVSTNKENGITLHRFPRDEKLCKEWVKIIGREGWIPTVNNVLCSDHFAEESFCWYNNSRTKKRLKPGVLPMIFPQIKFEPQTDILEANNYKDNLHDVPEPLCLVENVPEPSIVIEYGESSVNDKEIVDTCDNQSTPMKKRRNRCVTETPSHKKLLHDHRYENSPRSVKKRFDIIRSKLNSTRKELKISKQQLGRLKKKVNSLVEVIDELKKGKLLPDAAYYCLSANEDAPMELFNRMLKNRKKRGNLTREKYPPTLRAFALTVHFYSPKAYLYIRKTFDLALPHPDVLRTWYSSVDAEPGFTDECFTTLKQMSKDLKEKGQKLICALVMDEMGTKKGCQRGRDGKIRGNVDLGLGVTDSDDLLEAKNALVLMVVMLDRHCKLPIGYFLINSLTAETKANLIQEALIRLHNAGVTTTSLTLDGPADHFAAVERLGARMHVDKKKKTKNENNQNSMQTANNNNNFDFKVHFSHPIPDEPEVNVILDPCHMLKNIRNCWGEYLILLDGAGNKIDWRFLQSLALLQESEGLRLGNRLHWRHIEYRKMIMKVALAAQAISSSVADSIEFCCNVLGLADFKGCEATVRFVRCVDAIFDFLNLRNPWGKGSKIPLKVENEHLWRPKLIEEILYLSKITEKNGTPIFLSRRKAGFIGFYTSVLSVFNIFDAYVKPPQSQMKYLLTYKISQDHIELFFCAIRGRSGWCPNPTATQFVSAYKRLLVRHEVSISTGNVKAMDNTKILHVSSGEPKKKHAKIDRYDLSVYDTVHNSRVAEKYGLNDYSQDRFDFDEISPFLNFAWAQSPSISDFSKQAIGYICGWLILSIKKRKKINCLECLTACEETNGDNISLNRNNPVAYIAAITRGKLIIPSRSVVQICLTTESLFRRACNANSGKPPVETNFPAILAAHAFKKLVDEKHNLFSELEDHDFEMLSAEEFISHTSKLTRTIISSYIELRLYALTKKYTLSVTGTNMRHFLTRSIVWAHQ